MAEMFGRVELITPERAKRLRENALKNRTIKPKNLAKIKRAITSGQFVPTHQGIAIDKDGHMFDGNHRCQAIIDTGIATNMFVIYNAPNAPAIDSGTGRSEKDQLYMSGLIEKDSVEWKSICIPLINFIIQRNYTKKQFIGFSSIDKHNAYLQIKDLIDDVIGCLYKDNKFVSSAILYSMACALKSGVSRDALTKWHKILVTGDFFDGDEQTMLAGRSILLFRDFVQKNKKIAAYGNIDETNVMIKKAMSSIDYFSRKIAVTKIYGAFIYPEITLKI